MDSRLFFVAGDLLANTVTGALVGWVCALVVVTGWNMFLTMFLTMAIGMLVGLVLFFPFGVFFGAMEVMLPVMFTGMVSGMVIGMYCAMMPLGAMAALGWGAACGVACIAVIWTLNALLRGRRTYGVHG